MKKFKTIAIFAAATILSAYLAVGCACDGNDCKAGTTVYVPVVLPLIDRPFVTFTTPANLDTGVYMNRGILATFSEPMDPTTLQGPVGEANFTCMGAAPVIGTVGYDVVNQTTFLTPSVPLLPLSVYTCTISLGAKNLSGVSMEDPYVWTFTTGATPDTTAPYITLETPADGSTGKPFNTVVTAVFSEPMDPTTINVTNFTLYQGITQINGWVTYVAGIAIFTPAVPLAPLTTYTATITVGATDVAGNALIAGPVPNPWTFTTGAAADTTNPTVIMTNPTNLATGVPINTTVNAAFSEDMNAFTVIAAASFLVTGPGLTPVSGWITYDLFTNIGSFHPFGSLVPDTTYTATITTAAQDLAGNPLLAPYVWTFKTAPVLVIGPLPVALGAAANFVGLSGSGISNLAPSLITGDLGVSPAGGAFITGMTCPQINGTVYIVDAGLVMPPCTTTAAASLAAAKLAAEVAYNDAAGRTLPAPATVSGDQGGLTLAPGIYKSTSSLSIASGSLTLDGQGNTNAVWIFQIATTLTTVGCGASVPCATGGNVFLINGAKAKNVFWQVGSSATIGQYTAFEGTIIAYQDISVNTGAQINGRLLAGSGPGVSPLGAITLLQNVINMPLP